MEEDGKTCQSPGNCCRHTQLQAAKWDFKVRGKCWVLRSTLRSKNYQNKNGENSGNDVVS